MHVPEHLEDLARRIRAAGAPTDFLESSIVEHVSRELGRKHAGEHAAAFVEALNETPGAPRARLWAKADRADVRVYFAGDLGYVSVGWDGSISGASIVPGRRSQSLTFSPDSLYPAQRRAYRQALEDYRAGLIERSEEHAQERVEKIAELRVALGVDADEDFDDEALERAAERAAYQEAHEGGWGRRNGALPGAFRTKFAFFDDSDYTPPPITETRRVLREAKRGDIVTVGRSQWVVMRVLGDIQLLAYKHPSKHTKLYEIRLERTGVDADEVIVFEVGGSGQRKSEDVASGPLRSTGETVDL